MESVGGTLMGLVSDGPSEGSVYRPSRMDLVEFIRQCDPSKVSTYNWKIPTDTPVARPEYKTDLFTHFLSVQIFLNGEFSVSIKKCIFS